MPAQTHCLPISIPWQSCGLFKVHLLGSAELALQSMADILQEPYLTATDQGKLLALATEVGEWERFEAQFVMDGRVALRSCAHGTYISCLNGGGGDVVCDRHDPGEWEMFQMVRVVVPECLE